MNNLKINKKLDLKNILSVLLSILVLFAVAYYVADKEISHITVTGSSEENVTNERALFNAYVQFKSPNRPEAVANLEEQTQNVLNQLRAFGIEDQFLKTASLNVYQEDIYDPASGRSSKGDWVASTNIEIRLEDGTKASELAELLASIELQSFDGPHFSIASDSTDESALLQKAFENAYTKAQDLAASQGRRIVGVEEISEVSTGGVMPFMRMDGLGGGGLPIEPGSSQVSKTVIVRFKVR